MDIPYMTEHLQEMLLLSNTPVPYCSPSEGVRFLLPAPAFSAHGSIYIGTLSEWGQLCETAFTADFDLIRPVCAKSSLLFEECTYLICVEADSVLPTAFRSSVAALSAQYNANILVANTSISRLLQELSVLFTRSATVSEKNYIEIYRNFWKDMAAGFFIEHEKTLKRLEDFPYPLSEFITCIVIRPQEKLSSGQILRIEEAIRDFFPHTNFFYNEGEWIVFYSQEKYTGNILAFSYEGLSYLLKQNHLNAGLSYPSRWPELLYTLYLTASASIDLGLRLKLTHDSIYTYAQYNPYYVIHLCAQKFVELHGQNNLCYLTHPDAVKLFFYDQENHSDLLDVLLVYLMNGGSLSLTSKQLYMHRNTVSNKLNKIYQILSHKFESGETQFMLLLSCMILKYYCDYTGRNL